MTRSVRQNAVRSCAHAHERAVWYLECRVHRYCFIVTQFCHRVFLSLAGNSLSRADESSRRFSESTRFGENCICARFFFFLCRKRTCYFHWIFGWKKRRDRDVRRWIGDSIVSHRFYFISTHTRATISYSHEPSDRHQSYCYIPVRRNQYTR